MGPAEASPRPADFLRKLLSMLEREDSDVIAWDNGKIYVIDPNRLGSEVLHKYFRHSKFSSFNRQLNYFGFKKIQGKGKLCPCVYAHEMLVGPELGNLLHIRRRTRPAPRHAAPKDAAATALAMQQQREWEANFIANGCSAVGRSDPSAGPGCASSRPRKVRRSSSSSAKAASLPSSEARSALAEHVTVQQQQQQQRRAARNALSTVAPLPAQDGRTPQQPPVMRGSTLSLEQVMDITSGLTFDMPMFGGTGSTSDSTDSGCGSGSGSGDDSGSGSESGDLAGDATNTAACLGVLPYGLSRPGAEDWPMSTRSSSSDYSTDADAEAVSVEGDDDKFLWDLGRTLDLVGPFSSDPFGGLGGSEISATF